MRSLPRAVPLVALGLAVLLGAGRDGRGAPLAPTRAWPAHGRRWCSSRCWRCPPLWTGRVRRREPATARGDPRLLGRGGRPPRRQGDAHPGARGAGHRLRQLPLGQHRRPDHARPHRPAVRAARAHPLRLARLGRPPQRPRPPAPGAHGRSRRPRPHRPPACGVGDVARASDLQYERYNTPRPRNFWHFVTGAPGLGTPDRLRARGAQRHRRRRPARRRADVPDDHRRCPTPRWRRSRSSDPVPIVRPTPTDIPAAGGGRRRRPRRRRGGRPHRRHRADPLLGVARPTTRSTDAARRRRHARRHRLQPQAGRAVDHGPPHPGLHRDRGRGAPRRRPHRQPPARCSPTSGDDATTVAAERGGVERAGHELRQPDHVHPRGAAVAGGRRRPGDRLAHRGVRRRPRRAHRADAGRDR